MNPLMKRLFHTVRDGLFIVSREAEVRFANEAALRLIPAALGARIPNPDLERMVASVASGYTALPHAEDIELGSDCLVADADVIRAHLMSSPVGTDLVVILHNLTESQFFDTAMSNFSSMLQRECGDDMEALSAALEALEQQIDTADADEVARLRTAVKNAGHAVFDTVGKLAGLAALSDGEALVAEERIVVAQWLTRTVEYCRRVAHERQVRILIDGKVEELPPVYGSEKWLDRVLIECIDNAVRYGAQGSEVYLSAVAQGEYVRISVRNMGAAGIPAHLRQRLLRPLYRGKNATASGEPGLGLGLSLARQVVELHGGRLVIDQPETDEIECAIEMPTGAPRNDSRQLDLEQAQRYARDLAQLMQRRTAKATS